LKLAGNWGDTKLDLPEGSWRDAITGAERAGSVPVSELLDGFPVALLAKEGR
jgi:(1->4)-alpha-D-glucan 1-alpha-D-glucosylmutase